MERKIEIPTSSPRASGSDAAFHTVSPSFKQNQAGSSSSPRYSLSSSPVALFCCDRTGSLSPIFTMVDDQAMATKIAQKKTSTLPYFHNTFFFEECDRALEDHSQNKETIIETYFSDFIISLTESLAQGRITYIAMDYSIKTSQNRLETSNGDPITGADLTAFLRKKFHEFNDILIIIPNSSEEITLRELIKAGANIISTHHDSGINYMLKQIGIWKKLAGLIMATLHEANEESFIVKADERERIILSFDETDGPLMKPST